MPLIIDRANGQPLFMPTLFVSTQLRARNQASSTIAQALQAIRFLLLVLCRLDIQLEERLRRSQFLTLQEVDAILDSTHFGFHDLVAQKEHKVDGQGRVTAKRRPEQRQVVQSQTATIRATYMRAYLGWLVTQQLSKFDARSVEFRALKELSALVLDAFTARSPSPMRRTTVNQRIGLTQEQLLALTAISNPRADQNPWQDEFVRVRNWLIVAVLLKLGIRRGELLNLKTSDIKANENLLLIARRADDADDPRVMQPTVKTRDRWLSLEESFLRSMLDYVLHWRSQIPGAKKHKFLFVASRTGRPLELSSVNKIFSDLRGATEGLPRNFSPHVLRHTWNDIFSQRIDASGVDEITEKRMRTALMGWSDHSSMPAVYTRRFIQRKANAAILDLQSSLTIGRPSEKENNRRTTRISPSHTTK